MSPTNHLVSPTHVCFIKQEEAINDESIKNATKNIAEVSQMKVCDVDEFLVMIGQFGRAQKLILSLLYIMMFPHSFHTLSWHFTGHSPAWRCTQVSGECNITGTFDVGDYFYESRCAMRRASWEFVKAPSYSIVTEWDLVCEKKEYPYIANSAMWFGWAIGSFIFGFLSDRFGRKKVLYISWTMMVTGAFICGFVNHFWIYTALAFFVGCGQGGVALTIYIMASELVGPKYKSITSGAGTGLTYTVCLCLLSIQAWLIQQWRLFLIVTSAPYVVLLLFYKFLPESIRWLRLNNRLQEAELILKKMCDINKRSWPENTIINMPSTSSKEGNLKDLFKHKELAIGSFIQCFVWFVIGQVYFGISLASDQLGGNMYRDFILTSLVGIPGNILVIILTNRLGRKRTMISSLGVGSLACVGVSLINPKSSLCLPICNGSDIIISNAQFSYIWARVTFGMLGQLCLALSFSSMYAWSLELMPTVIRSQGMGILSVVTRFGGCSAPWIAQWLEYKHYVLPFAVMAGFAFVSSLLCFKLPETLGVPTNETLKDSLRTSRHKRKTNKATTEIDVSNTLGNDNKELEENSNLKSSCPKKIQQLMQETYSENVSKMLE